jgi:hypothetical protein
MDSIIKGQVGVPTDYFLRMAKHDYTAYRKALAREFFQNSADAGAKNIIVEFDDDSRTVTVIDDGFGMDLDTLQNKLLVLGGSKKREGSVGAFGKAKEILFFSWESYSIRTRDLHCVGTGASYEIKKRSNDEDHSFTICDIVIPETENLDYIKSSFRHVASLFEVSPTIRVNGEEVDSLYQRHEFLKQLPWADVYCGKSKSTNYFVSVRIDGQWMFDHYHGMEKTGDIIVELNRQSTDILTSNRDGIVSKFSMEFSKLIKEIISNRRDFITPPKKLVREIITGQGTIKVNWQDHRNTVREQLSDGCVSDFLLGTVPAIDIVSKIVGSMNPDFVLIYEEDNAKCGMDSFILDRKVRILAHAWTEIVKQVLIDIEWTGEFVCGFDYSKDVKASYEREDDINYFYLNPDAVLRGYPDLKSPFSDRRLLRLDLLASACHEVAHIKCQYHDESFIENMETITQATWKSHRLYTAIMKDAFTSS